MTDRQSAKELAADRLSDVSDVVEALDRRFDDTLAELVALAEIPGVSAAGFDPGQVARSADLVRELVSDAGLENARVVEHARAHPYVLAQASAAASGAPTVLIYAHHDVQPPGRAERWVTPAFEPTLRDDGRLYGRGVVDDKAGLLLHLAAIRAWREARGGLPVNLKLVVEGEEEIGSPHLAGFLAEHRAELDADVLVLSDTANLETGLPSLTVSLRGLVSVDVHVRALSHPIHSGMWGGPVLDAATALARILSRLVDDRGRVALDALYSDLPEIDPELRAEIEALPFDEAAFRRDAGMPPSARLGGEPARCVYERLWRQPSVAVTALEAVPLAQASSQLIDEAQARVGVRLAPGQDPARVQRALVAELERAPPFGVAVTTTAEAAVPGWATRPVGPAFDAARRALAAGYSRPAVAIGCGGTIPFVGPFAEVLGDVPALLLGLEDPACNAHGENESLHLGDFRKAAHAAVHLLDELSRADL